MEKTMSVEERIRKAEGIYYKKNGLANGKSYIEEEKKGKGNIKKMFMQIFICLMIYVVFYTATNREYIFSEDFRKEVNLFFTEKINISEMYNNVKTNIQNNILKDNEQVKNKDNDSQSANDQNTNTQGSLNNQDSKNTNSQGNVSSNSNNQSNQASNNQKTSDKNSNSQNAQNKNTQKNNNNEENIGGAEEDVKQDNTKKEATKTKNNEDKNTKLSQMEKDAKNIKKKIKFILPIKGTITSKYGWRNPTTSTVPKNHTGLDIGAVEGTKIKSATNGTVILASSEGDYGKHYQIKVQNVILVYAHCKKLYLKKGDKVKQGQEIAEVGSTGNSTGPHLHFEIRIEDRKVDPQMILDI